MGEFYLLRRHSREGTGRVSEDFPAPPPSNVPAWGPETAGNQKAAQVFGAWFLVSKGTGALQGPLSFRFADAVNTNDWLWQIHDPGNGAISWGDIIAHSEVKGYDVNVTCSVAGFNWGGTGVEPCGDGFRVSICGQVALKGLRFLATGMTIASRKIKGGACR